MLTFIWIEGERNLDEFCEKRFKERPRWRETCGTVGTAKLRLIYKEKPDGHYTDCYLLYMEARDESAPNVVGDHYLFDVIQRWSYEEIAANRYSILKR